MVATSGWRDRYMATYLLEYWRVYKDVRTPLQSLWIFVFKLYIGMSSIHIV
jgi:hypothetical protein